MHLAIIGTGYVGLVAGAGFADFGNDVVCADVDQSKIDRLNKGEMPIYEPGLDDLIARNAKTGRIRFTTGVEEAIRGADIVFVAVGTPPAADGSADMSAVYRVAETFGRVLDRYKVIVNKSTVPVGTADKVREIVSGLTTHPFAVASNPEFLKEGAADLAGGLVDEAEVGGAVDLALRGADREDHDVGALHGGRQIGGEAQAPGVEIVTDELGQARLVNRDLSLLEASDARGVEVDAHDIVAEVAESGAGDEADVTRSDDGETHVGPGL